ncbi:2-dehydro-3-deoxy-6-phosphogalactonate aldolase [Kozakia baliensis]|uniref:2-dehydro-3-deoxy-6-phosphogalactonate aldolase n=1 Tax=Kozakia baliensis TaxID=153496 RepID=A0A1D8UW42_9PROT|nr:2-dehydro-3-deoxy-6-phosphogalactonate aldolase [Kozakia baliensis]AOX17849.1 2-dehydro-3-deoxy-6-phosphogalactonate aldolase [Kozakia baliensis]GBR26735.1 2-keto-3-deoxy-6-phosphogluconate aldolase [Kozakia baliensis NRIC 0488]GEL64279.1 2-dehydro-3-deoxy-6-phosphogalactonate aldolase [Kozakia baliensis]
MKKFESVFAECPLIAILRGVRPDEVLEIGEELIGAGFRAIEVPMNSPSPLESIKALQKRFGDQAMIGAGTVLSVEAVEEVGRAGGRLIVMPHGDVRIVAAAKARGMICTPGVATPTEGFAALGAGADALKLFPSEQLGPAVLKAWRSVFPKDVRFLPVGGITPDNMMPWLEAGAAGFGLGSALYRKGDTARTVGENARRFVSALRRG